MKKIPLLLASLTLCLLVLSVGTAQATTSIKNNWNAFYADVCPDLTNAANDCSLCHGGGFSLNAYGSTLESNTFTQAESIDSDDDGRTNGEEIWIDCTMPGDSLSPEDVDSWGTIKALFR